MSTTLREVIINEGRGCSFFMVSILAEREDVRVSEEKATTWLMTRHWPYLIEADSKDEAVRLSIEAALEVAPELAEWKMKGVAHEMSVEMLGAVGDADHIHVDMRIRLATREAAGV